MNLIIFIKYRLQFKISYEFEKIYDLIEINFFLKLINILTHNKQLLFLRKRIKVDIQLKFGTFYTFATYVFYIWDIPT